MLSNFALRLLDKNFEEQLCERKMRSFDVPFNVCLGLCFPYNHRQESTITHMGKGERERHSITGYIACCLVWNIFPKAVIEVAAENELSAVILFIQHVSLPEALYFKAFKVV